MNNHLLEKGKHEEMCAFENIITPRIRKVSQHEATIILWILCEMRRLSQSFLSSIGKTGFRALLGITNATIGKWYNDGVGGTMMVVDAEQATRIINALS
ncbi:hypothetical protein Lal_00041800 [Lupinus albus]|nr:hypothetical protein Lal_00041800 [Lupinus albus]